MHRKDALISLATLAGGLVTSTTGLAVDAAPSVQNLGKSVSPPAKGPVNVGIVMGPDLVSIDMFGPMAAFGNAFVGKTMDMSVSLFNIYAIAAGSDALDVDGLKVQPQYMFSNAPQPHVLIVPQQQSLPATLAYIKAASVKADITASICTGAFLVAKAGLFDGQRATTHHDGYDALERMFPKIQVVRGPRYVENRNVSSSGGESSGIDLALRIVERYYGAQAAQNAAYNMEYRRTPRPLRLADA